MYCVSAESCHVTITSGAGATAHPNNARTAVCSRHTLHEVAIALFDQIDERLEEAR